MCSLEQIDLLFEEGVPARASRVWGVAHRDIKLDEALAVDRRTSEADKGEVEVVAPLDVLSKV